MRNSIVKLGLFLLIVSGVAGLCLGYVNDITSSVIFSQEQENKINSYKEVFPGADDIKDETSSYLDGNSDSIIAEVNVAYKNGNPAGVIYTVEPKGYGGIITALVGFDIEQKRITAVKVLSHTETPGLGAKAGEPHFWERFAGKDAMTPLEVVKQAPAKDNQVQAITAATITSRAVTEGINAAREHFTKNFLRP